MEKPYFMIYKKCCNIQRFDLFNVIGEIKKRLIKTEKLLRFYRLVKHLWIHSLASFKIFHDFVFVNL